MYFGAICLAVVVLGGAAVENQYGKTAMAPEKSLQDIDRQIRDLQEKRRAALEQTLAATKQTAATLWDQLKHEIDALRQHDGHGEFSLSDIDASAGDYLLPRGPRAKGRGRRGAGAKKGRTRAAQGLPEFSGDPDEIVAYLQENGITTKAQAQNARSIGAGVGAKVAPVLNQLAEEKRVKDNGETGSRRKYWARR
jgi:hypothetical protein